MEIKVSKLVTLGKRVVKEEYNRLVIISLMMFVVVVIFSLIILAARPSALQSTADEQAVELTPENVSVSLDRAGADGVMDDKQIYFWTDEETGVRYVAYSEKYMNAGFGGITPRLNSDGTIYTANNEETKENSNAD